MRLSGVERKKRRRQGDILKNKVLFVLPIKPFFELDSELSGRGREAGREKIEREREWWRWPLLLSTLIAALMPVMLQRQPRQRGIGWRWWNRLRGFPVPAGLALAQQKALCTATQLLLLSQRPSRRRGSSRVGGLGAGLTGGGEWEEEFGKRRGLVVESETVLKLI